MQTFNEKGNLQAESTNIHTEREKEERVENGEEEKSYTQKVKNGIGKTTWTKTCTQNPEQPLPFIVNGDYAIHLHSRKCIAKRVARDTFCSSTEDPEMPRIYSLAFAT